MTRLSRAGLVGAALAFTASAVRAQANVNGIAYDSLSRAPLRGATVQLVSADDPSRFGRAAVSDSLGRFAFADVPNGKYTLGFFHPMLDSLGVSAPAREVFVSGRRAVRADLAIPGAERIAKAICGTKIVADSSGVAIGFVRDARTREAMSGAKVTGEWVDLTFSTSGVSRRTPHLTATTGENGWFAVCGVPSGGSMTLVAVHGADSTDRVDVNISADGFARRDLYIGTGARDGRVSGSIVTADNGQPLPGAQIAVQGGATVRANDRGIWTIADAPLGTHNIDVRAVGFYPEHRAIDVVDDAPPVRIALSTMKAVLDTVKVSATRTYSRNLAVFETHRRSGIGTYITREQVLRRASFRLSDLFRSMNGIRIDRNIPDSTSILVRGAGEWCVPSVWIDNMLVHGLSADELDTFVQPKEVLGIELYAGIIAPPQFQTPLGGCGALVIWTR